MSRLGRSAVVLLVLVLGTLTSLPVEARNGRRATVAAAPTATAITAGGWHTCALMSDGTGRCWGRNGSGQVGDDTTTPRSHPVTVVKGNGRALTGLTAISAGLGHTCALADNGVIWCWGRNDLGQLGAGDTDPHVTAVKVQLAGGGDLLDATAVVVGGRHTCARRTDGKAWCWGSNDSGQAGPAANPSTTPVQQGVGAVAELTAGGDRTCLRRADDTVACWGRTSGPDQGFSGGPSAEEVRIAGGDPLASAPGLATDGYHGCAPLSSGRLRCWGWNEFGELGDDSTAAHDQAANVTIGGDAADAVDIAAGGRHACALRSGGAVWCWGDDQYGQLGDGTSGDLDGVRLSPVKVRFPALPTVTLGMPGVTNTRLIDIDLDATADPVTDGITGWFVSEDATAPERNDPGWIADPPASFKLSDADGGHTIHAWVQDADGTVSDAATRTVLLDRVAPIASVPGLSLMGSVHVTDGVRVRLGWAAAVDPGSEPSGVIAYQLLASGDGGANWMSVGATDKRSYISRIGVAVGPSRLGLEAEDAAGNISDRAESRDLLLRLLQEAAPRVTYSGTWNRSPLAGSSGGRVAWSSTRGHRATITVDARSIAIVSSRGRDRGIMAIRLDGQLVGTVDLYLGLSRPDTARTVWVVNGLPAGQHTVEIRVTGRKNPSSSGRRIDVDAFLVVR